HWSRSHRHTHTHMQIQAHTHTATHTQTSTHTCTCTHKNTQVHTSRVLACVLCLVCTREEGRKPYCQFNRWWITVCDGLAMGESALNLVLPTWSESTLCVCVCVCVCLCVCVCVCSLCRVSLTQ